MARSDSRAGVRRKSASCPVESAVVGVGVGDAQLDLDNGLSGQVQSVFAMPAFVRHGQFQLDLGLLQVHQGRFHVRLVSVAGFPFAGDEGGGYTLFFPLELSD